MARSLKLPTWTAPVTSTGRLVTQLPWLTLLVRGAQLFWRQNSPGMAATIAFFGFLSLVPLVILLLAFMGGVVGGVASGRDVQLLFHGAVPGLTQHQFLHTYWYPIRHSRVATTILGAVTLLLGTLGLHDSVDWAVNRMWESTRSRSFWVKKLRGLAIILWVIIFAAISLWLTWLLAAVTGVTHLPGLATSAAITVVASLIVDVTVFTALYKLTPTLDVRPAPALFAGVVAAIIWEISKFGFGWWVLQVGTYNRVYGPLAATVIVMLWVWMSAMIFLYGAAVSVEAQRASAPESRPQRHRIVV